MATGSRSGRVSRRWAPLLILLILEGSAAVSFSAEREYRQAREAADWNDLVAAKSAVDRALALAGEDHHDSYVWSLRVLRAELIARQGPAEKAEALEVLEPELPLRFRSSEAAVRRLAALGMLHKEPAYCRQAYALAATHQPYLLARTQVGWGNVEKFAEGEPHLLAAVAIALRTRSAYDLALARSSLAFRYTREGHRYAEAVEAGEETIAIWKSFGLRARPRLAAVSGNLGWTYLELGEQARALELFQQAIDVATRAKLDHERVTWTNQLGNTLFAERDFAAAEGAYREALKLGRQKDRDQLGDILTNRARTDLELGRYREARQLNSEAIAERRRPDPSADIRSNKVMQARIDAMTGHLDRAKDTLIAVLAEESKKPDWEAEARLAQLYVAMGRADDADASFQRAIDTFRSAREAVKSSELRLSFINTAEDLFDTYIDFLVRAGRVEDALIATEQIRAQTLLEVSGQARRDLDPRAIARQRGTTILSYWLGRRHSYVWTVTPSAIVLAQLPPEETINSLADRYRADLLVRNGSIESSGERGGELYRMLVEPALHGAVPAAPIAVIADGRLHALNFETLITDGDQPHYWIEDVVLSSASSLQILARAEAESEPVRKAGMFLVGDALTAPGYPALQHAGVEIANVARHFRDPKILTRERATPAGYRAADPGRYAFIHFVAHGVASGHRPLDSAIILSPDASGYKLIARDIMAQPLTARLVTISSCQGAGERTYAGEGLVGLAWAFLRSGADEVVAALWDVDDSTTPAFMDQFYAGIQAGRTPAAALRDAKLSMVRSKEVYRFPRYWAPFVLYSGS